METGMTRSPWLFYLEFFKGFERPLLVSTLGSVLAAAMLLAIPWLIRYTFNEVIPQERYGLLVLLACAALGIQLAYLGIVLWVRGIVYSISREVTKKLRHEAVQKLYELSERTYNQINRATLHAKFIIDIGRVDQMSDALVGRVIPAVVTSLLLIAGMLVLSWKLFILAVLVFSSLIPVSRWAGNRFRGLASECQDIERHYSAMMEFSIHHFLLTKLRSAEDEEIDRHRATINRLAEKGRSLEIWRSTFVELQNLFAFATAVVLLSVGVASAYAGWLTLGDVLAFYVLAMLFRGQYILFSQGLSPVLEGAQSLYTVQEVLTFRDEPPYNGHRRIEFQGRVRLRHVHFGYNGAALLDDVDFELEPGEVVGIVGPNGAGKTTLIKLILGFVRPGSGQVIIDDTALDDIDIRAYRSQVGAVMQEPMVLAGTIAGNVTYGDPVPDMEKVKAAAAIATLDEFVANLPDGYDTCIGDDGLTLSGGQKQKISIARAVYGEPNLLILDEPTNHLDSRSIDRILGNLDRLPRKPGAIIISHDARALREIDAIYRLENGSLHRVDAAGVKCDSRREAFGGN
jgi:ABC-type bacteriocin/lantibiotic exporter with double-glycine peptidase domain